MQQPRPQNAPLARSSGYFAETPSLLNKIVIATMYGGQGRHYFSLMGPWPIWHLAHQ